jgi:hypothetical protein
VLPGLRLTLTLSESLRSASNRGPYPLSILSALLPDSVLPSSTCIIVCVCVCMYTYIHILYIYMYIHACVHKHCIHCAHIYIYLNDLPHTRIYIYAYIHSYPLLPSPPIKTGSSRQVSNSDFIMRPRPLTLHSGYSSVKAFTASSIACWALISFANRKYDFLLLNGKKASLRLLIFEKLSSERI